LFLGWYCAITRVGRRQLPAVNCADEENCQRKNSTEMIAANQHRVRAAYPVFLPGGGPVGIARLQLGNIFARPVLADS